MRLLESLRIAITGLLSNRLRSVLTMLGIVIGVAAVIALVSFGQGFQQFVTARFQALGSNLITVFPTRPGGPNSQNVKPKPLTMSDVQAISNPIYVTGVTAVAPVYNVSGAVTANGNSLTMNVQGTTPAWQVVRDWAVADGRFIDQDDVNGTANVAVLGSTTVSKLFDDGSDPVGQLVNIKDIPFRVIGVLVSKGGFGDADQVVIVPLTTAQKHLGETARRASNGEFTVSTVLIKAVNEQQMSTVQAEITQLLTERHDIQFVGLEDFRVLSQEQILTTVNNVTGLITLFLGVVAGISLVVGGIGVMNIMLVSVTERTREIGLRKAVGARYFDLLSQFLIESTALSLGGGLLGVLLGALVAYIGSQLIPNLTLSITPAAVILAAGVSIAIGIFFGVYPASRAAALNPIEALRYE
jgi:putative ABC transport system permease protein